MIIAIIVIIVTSTAVERESRTFRVHLVTIQYSPFSISSASIELRGVLPVKFDFAPCHLSPDPLIAVETITYASPPITETILIPNSMHCGCFLESLKDGSEKRSSFPSSSLEAGALLQNLSTSSSSPYSPSAE
ncbi:uncharacterized protein MYCFIDRAFT_179424 [Pseudocercospora fijiensis CIRAD86]|uniref:Uncharacterized protein n=1 Tax=Pseudocercospora fijiensis (strain CIRAD86) TaxID=383855 RepID=M3ALD7_PSEFD|nr:uncharacterized protein MYCFIDRAFT_179424 [Pseudocercospora fijiensis CIRAD86]EME77973.1 hypothetical protein MYCFIDRAFT_179424 [Pseudocercospora fijiensis CIRAD86]